MIFYVTTERISMSEELRGLLNKPVLLAINNYAREPNIYRNLMANLDDVKWSVEMFIYDRIRPIGAAPVRHGESKGCKDMIEVLKESDDETLNILADRAVKQYVANRIRNPTPVRETARSVPQKREPGRSGEYREEEPERRMEDREDEEPEQRRIRS
ncbi:MAG: hypothetical protein V1887_02955 [Candidatus Aenigmatarchaeota archaeon]